MDNINKRISERFQIALDTIKRQTECEHIWPEKDGTAYYRCTKCDYLADDLKLDRFITIEKMRDKGLSLEEIERFMKYI
jgi:DNA-binding transcriptional MerR regulator